MNRDWLPLHLFGLVYSILFLVALLPIPESPKFLYAKKRFKEARESLAFVSRLNRVPYYD